MLKKLTIILLFVLSFLAFPGHVHAQEQFSIDTSIQYRIQDDGQTRVIHNVTLTNLYSDLYATNYQLSLENFVPQDLKAEYNGQNLSTSINTNGTTTSVDISFPDAVVGKGKKRNFSISFLIPNVAKKTGEVWEIEIPALSTTSNYGNYEVKLYVPRTFGQEAYISPEPKVRELDSKNYNYLFTKDILGDGSIDAGFGKFQVFSFTLNYHLENPLSKQAKTEIALPPDTSFQQVYYENLTPKPETIDVDEDGNWIATYLLDARERVDVVAKGEVQIFSFPRRYYDKEFVDLQKYLEPTDVWQVNDPRIQSLAKQLGTPQAIYDYVVNTLKYDYSRVRPNVERFGAVKALQNQDVAICMEFTDLFIALSRAAGYPAREVNGFAYTENPEIQPLSLVADVLHAWPEYWDESQGVWVPIDPTWGSTSGVDYFNKLDLRHFAFVMHGVDYKQPYPPGSYKLGKNPQKDVFVGFGELPEVRASKPILTASVTTPLPIVGGKINVTIENQGPTALYEKTLKVYFDGKYKQDFVIDSLYPFTQKQIVIPIPFSFLGTKTPDKVTIALDSTVLDVPSNKSLVIIYNLLGLFVLIFIILIWFLKKSGKLKFSIKKTLANVFKKHKKVQVEQKDS